MTSILAIIAAIGFLLILAVCGLLRKPNDCIKYIVRDVEIPDDTPEKRIARAAAAMRLSQEQKEDWWSL